MTAAFYHVRTEPEFPKYQATRRPVPYILASKLCPALPQGEIIYPAMAIVAVGWQSACGILQHTRRSLCSLLRPLGAGLDPNREVRSAMHRHQAVWTRNGDHFSRCTLMVFSQGELRDLTSVARFRGPADSAVQQSVGRVEVLRQTSKEIGQRRRSRGLGTWHSQKIGPYLAPDKWCPNCCRSRQGSPSCRTQLQEQTFQLRHEVGCVVSDFWC